MDELVASIIERSLGENGLPVLARMGEDPGQHYFSSLIKDLKQLCQQMKDQPSLSKELCYALYCLGRYPYVEYTNALRYGKSFREDLFDPQIIELEMAVESVFNGEWMPYLIDGTE